jgi:hypothetical protein
MPTPAEIQQKIDGLFNEWESNFSPLFLAVNDMKVEQMRNRIFEQFANTDGQKLPLPARKKSSPELVQGYTPAYARIKAEKNRLNRPLELTGFLNREWSTRPAIDEGLNVSIVVDDSEAGKVEGLTALYGDIFLPSDAEQQAMLEVHAELLAQSINEAIR